MLQPARRAAVAALLVVVAVLVGCSSNDSEDATAPATPTSTTAGSGVTRPVELPELPVLEDPTGISGDAVVDSCATDPGDVTAEGTVENRADEAADIVVRVSWVTVEGSRILGQDVQAFEDVEPGATEAWSLAATIAGDEPIRCALNVQRGTLG